MVNFRLFRLFFFILFFQKQTSQHTLINSNRTSHAVKRIETTLIYNQLHAICINYISSVSFALFKVFVSLNRWALCRRYKNQISLTAVTLAFAVLQHNNGLNYNPEAKKNANILFFTLLLRFLLTRFERCI